MGASEKYVFLDSVNVILPREMVFAHIIKNLVMKHAESSQWVLDPMTSVLMKDTETRHMEKKKRLWKMEEDLGIMPLQPRMPRSTRS